MITNLQGSVPTLQISSAARSCEFYCGKLGFQKNWEDQFEPRFPWFVSISRGSVTLFLTEHPESAAGALVYFYVEDVDAPAQEFQARGVVIEQGPVSQSWGMREIQLQDPDGNHLRFGQQFQEKKS